MSLSNPRQENPAKKFIDFKGDKGIFQYFDKDKEENIELQMPIAFIVLDELSTITGFDNKSESGIYSNEIHRIDEILRVKSFKGNISIIGKYADIKHELKSAGGKFCKSVYALLLVKTDDTNKFDYELVNFKFKGAAFSSWLDKKFNTEKYGIMVKSIDTGEKGSIKYQVPIFEAFTKKGKEKIWNEAIKMDVELQKYLSWYKHQQSEQLEIKNDTEKENNEFNDLPKGDEIPESDSNKNENANKIFEDDNKVKENTEYDSTDDLPF